MVSNWQILIAEMLYEPLASRFIVDSEKSSMNQFSGCEVHYKYNRLIIEYLATDH